MWRGSGVESFETDGNEPVVVMSRADIPVNANNVRIFNTGTVEGFYSLDGGQSWDFLPAEYDLPIEDVMPVEDVRIKRVEDGDDVTGVYVSAW